MKSNSLIFKYFNNLYIIKDFSVFTSLHYIKINLLELNISVIFMKNHKKNENNVNNEEQFRIDRFLEKVCKSVMLISS
jgi:hypothetical protein